MNTSAKKVIIIGGGPAGMTCGYQLIRAGYEVEIFEANDQVGGLAKSFELWGQTVDCGPHRFFSGDDKVNGFFKEVIQDDYVTINRLTRIYYNGKFFYYPLRPFNIFFQLGIFRILNAVFSYIKQRICPIKSPKTFDEWIINRFGRKLFNIFFKHYTEKLWGIPSSSIDASWASQRIKKFSLYQAVITALFGDKNKKHYTLVDSFMYPKNGAGDLYKKMQKYIIANGGHIHLNTSVKKVLLNEKQQAIGVSLFNGSEVYSDHIVSTMPLSLMVKRLNNIPSKVKDSCKKLFYRNSILVYLEIDAEDIFPDNWLYIHDPELKYGRLTNFRNWSPFTHGDKNTTILCMEYWCFDKEDIWIDSDENISMLAKMEIRNSHLLPPKVKILGSHVLRLPKSYPVYKLGYKKHLKIIQNYVDDIPNLTAIGRYGAFKYNNQDHSIKMGLVAAKEIISGKNLDLWEINTDSDYQEESQALKSN